MPRQLVVWIGQLHFFQSGYRLELTTDEDEEMSVESLAGAWMFCACSGVLADGNPGMRVMGLMPQHAANAVGTAIATIQGMPDLPDGSRPYGLEDPRT